MAAAKPELRNGANRAILLAALSALPATALAQYAHPRPKPTDIIEEVHVTARRRSEKVQDVPIAISVLTGRQLQRIGATQVQDLQFLVPSTNISLPNPRQTNFAIRGIGNNPATDGLSSSVGIYIDDVYLDRPGMADFNLLDIDQIEVLRGPQGTLFGKNTTAGAISILTKGPQFTQGGQAQIEEGSRGTQLYRIALTGPITSHLAYRITAYDTSHDPFVRNIDHGADTLSLARRGVRGQLLYKPNADLSIRLSAEYAEESDSQGDLLFYSPGPATSKKKGFVPFDVWAARYGLPTTPEADALETTINSLQHIYQRQQAVSAEVNWNLGVVNLTSITAYRTWEFSPNNDFDWTAAPSITTNGVRDNDKQASEEVRVASATGGPIDYVAGIYAFWRRLDAESDTLYGPGYSTGLTPAAAVFNNAHSLTAADPTTQSYAAFAQGTWHITHQLDATLGYRETYELNDEQIRRTSFPGTEGLIPASLTDYRGGVSVDNWNYAARASVDYKLASTSMVYASVSRGAKAGGFNSPAVPQSATGAILPSSSLLVAPEKATAFELGVKNTFLDHRLILDADAFWTHVDDYQANTLVVSPSGIFPGILNVGAVRSAGFELEGTYRPVRDLAIIFSGSYDDAIYDSFRNAPAVEGAVAPTQDLTGRPVVGASRWTASVTGSYSHPLTDRLEFYAVAQYGYKSAFYGDIDDSRYSRLPAAGITNFRVGTSLDGGRFDIALWARNAFDTRYFYTVVNAISGAGGYFAAPGDPATYGVALSSNF
jgi:iron complex outermembrane receptor protein